MKSWPIWECEPSKFQWNYDDKEICLIIEGQAKISTQNGDIYEIKAGDLVEFPAGLNCEWEVTKSIKKHYRLGSCLLYTSPSPRDLVISRMPSSA